MLERQMTYKQIFKDCEFIEIPMIQRDYAQGRQQELVVREEFLTALQVALESPIGDPSLPCNLDFIYGSAEGVQRRRFMSLDGQQRLTTLFLLHWYLAWKDRQWDDFKQSFCLDDTVNNVCLSRFYYSVRPSSTDFFNQLVQYRPTESLDVITKLSELIINQFWYVSGWRLDPTIQSVLGMLDAIHCRFHDKNGCYARLTDDVQPAITFQLLNLEHFGLSDDLYIKMNARGKPLTPFETFKARYEQELNVNFSGSNLAIGQEKFSLAEFVARKMDTTWADLFWTYRDKNTNLYDAAIMNLFRIIALITRDPESGSYEDDIRTLRDSRVKPSYSDYYDRKWLDERFTRMLITLLEAWSETGEDLKLQLPNVSYFNEQEFFTKISLRPTELSYTEIVLFFAYAIFLNWHKKPNELINKEAFQEWMRIVLNLSVNSSLERVSDLARSISGLLKLNEVSLDLLRHFAIAEIPTTSFYGQQVNEEKVKAELILSNDEWRNIIDKAESHGYFKGQIEFLLDFSGILSQRCDLPVAQWDDNLHDSLQKRFVDSHKKSELMFGATGLKYLNNFRWQRGLLTEGNYFLPIGRNISFLIDAATEPNSWKRLLRGSESRKFLFGLWSKISLNGDSLELQLDNIINNKADIDSWRKVLIDTPNAFAYCKERLLRKNTEMEIYLLTKTQMNGTHAELFTYALYERLLAAKAQYPVIKKITYIDVFSSEFEPSIQIVLGEILLTIEFSLGRFVILFNDDDVNKVSHLKECLELLEFKYKPKLCSYKYKFDFVDTDSSARFVYNVLQKLMKLLDKD